MIIYNHTNNQPSSTTSQKRVVDARGCSSARGYHSAGTLSFGSVGSNVTPDSRVAASAASLSVANLAFFSAYNTKAHQSINQSINQSSSSSMPLLGIWHIQ
jgi:hypothetical protein